MLEVRILYMLTHFALSLFSLDVPSFCNPDFFIPALPSTWYNNTQGFSFLNTSAFVQLAALFLNSSVASLLLHPLTLLIPGQLKHFYCQLSTTFLGWFFLLSFNGAIFNWAYIKYIIGMGLSALYVF